jgi:NAD(P)-dependent dehydrogenase (short-subunit alcohol dehydrogenase family)
MQKSQRVCLVTGGTEGIGRAVSVALARAGDRVLFAGRDPDRGRAVLAELAAVSRRDDHVHIPVDLSLVAGAYRLAREVQERTPRLDAMVCCAGLLSTIPEWTSERLERTFVLNYLSRYVLARTLMPMLIEAPSGRLVLVANAGMYKDTLDFTDLQHRRGRPGLVVSARTQFANDMLATALADEQRANATRVEVTCVFPGMVRTGVFDNARGLPWLFRALKPVLRLFQIAPEVAAETPVFLARSDEAIGTNGRFFGPRCTPRRVPPRAIQPERRQRLINASYELVRARTREGVDAGRGTSGERSAKRAS